jgi:hypothetical protein
VDEEDQQRGNEGGLWALHLGRRDEKTVAVAHRVSLTAARRRDRRNRVPE